jgi:hypothetical protein
LQYFLKKNVFLFLKITSKKFFDCPTFRNNCFCFVSFFLPRKKQKQHLFLICAEKNHLKLGPIFIFLLPRRRRKKEATQQQRRRQRRKKEIRDKTNAEKRKNDNQQISQFLLKSLKSPTRKK